MKMAATARTLALAVDGLRCTLGKSHKHEAGCLCDTADALDAYLSDPVQPLAYKVSTAAKLLDESVWQIYNHISAGRLEVIKYHERGDKRVTAESLHRLLNNGRTR